MTFLNVQPPEHKCALPIVTQHGVGTLWTCNSCTQTYYLTTARGQDRFGVWSEKKVWLPAPSGKAPMSCTAFIWLVGGVLLGLAILITIVVITANVIQMLTNG